jgi:hypothetical protein
MLGYQKVTVTRREIGTGIQESEANERVPILDMRAGSKPTRLGQAQVWHLAH